MDSVLFTGCHVIFKSVYCGFAAQTAEVKLDGSTEFFADPQTPLQPIFANTVQSRMTVQAEVNRTGGLQNLLNNGKLSVPSPETDLLTQSGELILLSGNLKFAWKFPHALMSGKFSQNLTAATSLKLEFIIQPQADRLLGEFMAPADSLKSLLPVYHHHTTAEIENLLRNFLRSQLTLPTDCEIYHARTPERSGIKIAVVSETAAPAPDFRNLNLTLLIRHSQYPSCTQMYDRLMAIFPVSPVNSAISGLTFVSAAAPFWSQGCYAAQIDLHLQLQKKQ